MTRPLFTVVVPTIGRHSLPQTLASINREMAEIIVVADTFEMPDTILQAIKGEAKQWGARFYAVDAGHHDWGSPQLQEGYRQARGAWIMNVGDDDIYEPFAFETIKRAIDSLAVPVPMMFRAALHPTYPDPRRGNTNIAVLWQTPEIVNRNVTGQCFVIPNDQSKIGDWNILVDFGFIESTVALWGGHVAWRTEIISQCF